MGLDLGQAADYTALTIIEKTGKSPALFQGKHLHRFPLGTPYPEIVREVGALLSTPQLVGKCRLVVDATGVGRPVVDLLRKARLRPIPVVITSGDRVTVEGGFLRVPKRDLAGSLQVLLQTQRLKIAATHPLVPVLTEEMKNFKVKLTLSGHDTYGAWREGQHDDLILSVALATWYATYRTGWAWGMGK